MLGDPSLVAFVGTADLGRPHEFYGGRLGLPLVESTAFANVYDTGGGPLRVTLVDGSRIAWFRDPDGNVRSLQRPDG